jgi:hypothetical protein
LAWTLSVSTCGTILNAKSSAGICKPFGRGATQRNYTFGIYGVFVKPCVASGRA